MSREPGRDWTRAKDQKDDQKVGNEPIGGRVIGREISSRARVEGALARRR